MGLESIEQNLKQAGYHAFIAVDNLMVGHNLSTDEELGIQSYDAFCRVFTENGRYTVDFSRAALPEEESFDQASEVISFIKRKFPIPE